MNTNFCCTKCGECCKNMWVALSIDEAVRWLSDGNTVQILCEAMPWPSEMPADNLGAKFKRERSFLAISGNLPVRILVTIAAPQGERCPNLNENNLCEIYDRRPEICKAYPAEKVPFVQFSPDSKKCPKDAWSQDGSEYIRDGSYVDIALRDTLADLLSRPKRELIAVKAVCSLLGIEEASLSNEGFAAHTPVRENLLKALLYVQKHLLSDNSEWLIISDRPDTIDAVVSCEAKASLASEATNSMLTYLSLVSK